MSVIYFYKMTLYFFTLFSHWKGRQMSKKSVFRHQYKEALKAQTHFGESKHKDKLQEREKYRKENLPAPKAIRGIYSTKTLKDYSFVCDQYIDWVLKNYRKEVKNYADTQKYAAEWLQLKEDAGLSAWSLHLYGSALAASYGGISKNDLGYSFPARERRNVTRNRNDDMSGEYRTERQRNAYKMLKACGCRRMEALRLRKRDFREQIVDGKTTGLLEVYKRGKGGIERWCLVNPNYTTFVQDFLKTAKSYSYGGEQDRLFEKNDITKGGIHSARAIYAADLYRYFEEQGTYTTGDIYYMRKDCYGYSYDKGILEQISYNLQHSRTGIVASAYLYLLRQ